MTTLTLSTNQVSPITFVPAGSRITSTGNGSIEWTPGSPTDAANSPNWKTWAKGSSAGYMDTLRPMSIRATATGSMTVTIEEGRDDKYGEDAYFDADYAQYSTDTSGNTVLVGADGNIPLNGSYLGYDTANPPSDLDWLSLRSPNEWADLVLASPYSPGHILHPSICDIKDTFGGYRYWVVYTPYPDNDSSFENPCIAASNDLVTWSYPATNPIVGDPGGSNYNSDTDIYFDDAGKRLVVLFREVTGITSQLKITTSSNGVDWSTPVTIYTSANFNTPTATDIATPSIWYNTDTSKWEIIGANITDNATAWPVVKITSDELLSGWDTSATWTVLTCAPPSGRKWWNFQFRRLSSGAVVGLAQDNNGTVGAAGNMYALYSSDGLTFAYKFLESQASKSWYRHTFCINHDQNTGKYSIYAIGSKLTEARLFAQTMQFDAMGFANTRAGSTGAIMSSASLGSIQGIIHADTFIRADDATGLGTSTSGHTYTQTGTAPTVIGISSNQAYPVDTAGNCQAYRNIGVTDCIAKMTVTEKTSGQAWLLLRFVDNNNKIRVGHNQDSQLTFQVITAGALAVNVQLGVTPVVGDEIVVSVQGNEYIVFLNGKRIAKRISNQGLTSTNFGLGMSGTAFKVKNLALISVA